MLTVLREGNEITELCQKAFRLTLDTGDMVLVWSCIPEAKKTRGKPRCPSRYENGTLLLGSSTPTPRTTCCNQRCLHASELHGCKHTLTVSFMLKRLLHIHAAFRHWQPEGEIAQ